MKVGFIGLGRMGAAMAAHLINHVRAVSKEEGEEIDWAGIGLAVRRGAGLA